MKDSLENTEDRKIRKIWIGLGIGAAAALILTVLTIAILIAQNFNILEWME